MSSDSGQPISLKPPRGTTDLLPGETEQWQILEDAAGQIMQAAGYKEIRVPIFEHTELFKRSVGNTTDIVNKEMYTFTDKSDRSLTLRPEGTAGVVRAYLNGGLHRLSPPVKLWYTGPMFRYERVQTGRQRQFHQIGVEALGSAGPLIDAEVILLASDYLTRIGIQHFEIQLNSIGDQACRPAYRQLLKEALQPKLHLLCPDCQDRFERNPLRMLDCKNTTCQQQYQDLPSCLDHLCLECRDHWQGLLGLLEKQGISYVINPRLVRGLDYYTRTVLEIVSSDARLGAQSTILAGGRYDKLVESLGGSPTPAVGWGAGLERLLLLKGQSQPVHPLAFVISSSPERALSLALELRRAGIYCELDYSGKGLSPRNFTKQLQQANKTSASWAVIAGDDEFAQGEVTLKDMKSGCQEKIQITNLVAALSHRHPAGGKEPQESRKER